MSKDGKSGQNKRWSDYNKGKVDREEGQKYPPFRDQDLKRLCEFFKEGDLVTELKLHWYFTADVDSDEEMEAWADEISGISEKEILGATEAKQALEDLFEALSGLQNPLTELQRSRKLRIEEILKSELRGYGEDLEKAKNKARAELEESAKKYKAGKDIKGKDSDKLLVNIRRRLLHEYRKRDSLSDFPSFKNVLGRLYAIAGTV